MEWQFIDEVARQTMRPVVGRDSAVRISVERVLRNRDFTTRRVEDLRRRVDELAPRVVHARAETTRQTFVEAGLQRVVARLGGIGPLADDANVRVHSHGRERLPRVAVERLEQVASLCTDVPHAQHDVSRQFALDLEAVLVVVRRSEVVRDDCARQVVRVATREHQARQHRERVGQIRAVDRCDKRRGARDIEIDVDERVVVGPRIAATNHQLVTAGQ